MRDVLEKLDSWRNSNQEITITTVVETWGSGPRPVGSKMITTMSGGIAGSVSAGCVESAVIEEAQKVWSSGEPSLIKYGVADDTAWEVGLACGGEIKVFIEPGWAWDSIYNAIKENIEVGKTFALVTALEGDPDKLNKKMLVQSDGAVLGDLILPDESGFDIAVVLNYLSNDRSGVVSLPNGTDIFIESYPLPAKLIVVGAVHLSDSLITMANAAGFETILIDPREAFGNRERFPHVDQLIRKWPQDALSEISLDRSTFIAVLTHDPKLDDPALMIALRSNARYVGALGSRRTNQKRLKRLSSAGLTEEQLSLLHAPIGLDLGGRSQSEIAISIMAEIIKTKNQIVEH